MAYVPFFFYEDGLSICLLPVTVFPSVLVLSQIYKSHTKERVCVWEQATAARGVNLVYFPLYVVPELQMRST